LKEKKSKGISIFFVVLTSINLLFLNCETVPTQVIKEIPSPASAKSSEPNLHLADNGTIYLSWIDASEDKKSSLKFSTLTKNQVWSEPKTIAEGTDWFVNWADFPSMTSFGENHLSSHYLEKSANGTYTYDVKLTFSDDEGNTWKQPITPHTDNTNSEHGFVSKLDLNNNSLLTVWLDGRQYAYSEENDFITKEMTLRGAIFNTKGDLLNEYLIDERVCDCCQTGAAMTANGPIVVYRNRTEDEVRDIYYSRLIENQWTEPKPVFNDQWTIAGCPVNGPSIDANDNMVAVSWYTMSDNVPKVKLAFSLNNGESFNAPIILSSDNTIGRVDLELLEDNSVIALWVDTIEEQAVIQIQRINETGEKSEILSLAKTSNDRSSGFPRMVIKDNIAYLTYTISGKDLSIRTFAVDINALELLEK
jgi:hypothetical protein